MIIMTATVTHWQGIELAAEGIELEVGADEQSFAIGQGWAPERPAGQLWEREAERDERSVFDTLSDRWLDVVFPVVKASWARETRSGAVTMEAAIRIGRGEPASQLDGWRDGHPHYRMHSGASGVIVSGQRRKVTARYIHTGFEAGAL